MTTHEDKLRRAKELLRAGEIAHAEALCGELLREFPNEPQLWHLLGFAAVQSGQLAAAELRLRQAAALDPTAAQIWCQLAQVARQQGRSGDAEVYAWRAVEVDAAGAAGWALLGECLADQQRWPDAAQALQQAVARNPRDAAAWLSLAMAENNQGRRDAALATFAQAAALRPDDEETVTRYALQLMDRGQSRQSIEILRGFLSQRPDSAPAWFVLGSAHEALGELTEAEAACRRSLALKPVPATRFALARVLHAHWQVVEAESLVHQLLAEEPKNADAWALLGHIQQTLSEPQAAVESLRKAVALAPEPNRHSRLLTAMQYADGVTPAELLSAHREWDANFGQRWLLPRELPQARSAGPLRLGFVSADLARHPISLLTLPGIEHLDPQQFSVTCYFDRHFGDPWTDRWRKATAKWRDIAGRTDSEAIEQIQADGIDVLFDFSGHVGRRAPIFARRAAPVQIAWLGYVGTTGLSAMNYLLADRWHVPAGEESAYAEKILRLPHSYICFGPPADAPPVGRLPALSAGHVTFGCFNNPSKYAPRILDAWAAILRRLPTARLLLKFGWLGERAVQAALRAKLVARGVLPEQVLIEGSPPGTNFLAHYQRVDLALDTQPYSGGLTTCEALWMGVPVVTFPGQTFAGRHSVSHLNNAGCPQFIAADQEGYVELAVEWAGRLKELAELRAGLREQVARSPLCDGPRFASDLAAAIRAVASPQVAKG